jgi:3-oxoacyl-[acyl-carrier protein] reductase
MDLRIEDRAAFVCGGSKGIGRAVSLLLAREGARVAVVARDREAIAATVGEIRAAGGIGVGVAADLSDLAALRDAVRQAREELGPIAITVFNGFTPRHGTFADLGQADFDDTYHLLVRCFAELVRQTAPDMKAGGWGRIVTVGSRSVKQPLRSDEVPYALANTLRIAGVGLSRTLADELGPEGITVNTVAAGRFDTGKNDASSTEVSAALGIGQAEYLADRLRSTPVRRLGRPEEIAGLVGYLCSDLGGFVTGQTIVCDGGRTEAMM